MCNYYLIAVENDSQGDCQKCHSQFTFEIKLAHKYAKCALEFKTEHSVLADTYYKLADEKLKHVGLLHAQVVNIINEYKKEHGDPPELMQSLYDMLHKQHIEDTLKVRNALALYRES